jgi:hypothetical protein
MDERQFQFWKKWLIAANAMTVGIGLVAAFASNIILLRPWNAGIEATYFNGNPLPPEVLMMKNWLLGVVGGTIVGFHLLMIFIAAYPFAKREKWAYNALWAGLLGWFCIDSGMSAFYGAYFNIYLINAFALLLIGLPLVMTRKAFGANQ